MSEQLKCPECNAGLTPAPGDIGRAQRRYDDWDCPRCHAEWPGTYVRGYWRGRSEPWWHKADLDDPTTLPEGDHGRSVIAVRDDGPWRLEWCDYSSVWVAVGVNEAWQWRTGDQWTEAPGVES